MNEQNDHIWMHKKPETVFDWLAIIAISIALYLMLGHLNVFAGGIAKFLDIAAPFASGIVIAYVLDCIVRPVQRYVMKENPKLRWLSILIAYIVAALIITLLVSMVVPQVVSSITMLFTNLPLYISNVQNLLDMLQNRYGLDLSRATEMLDNYESMMNSLTEVLKSSAPQIMAYVSGVASNVVDIFTALASSVYMLAEKDKLLRQLRTMVHAFFPPYIADTVLETCSFANNNFEGFFGGKIIDSAIIGVLTFVCCNIFSIEFAPLIAVVVGITNIIPVFGPFIGAIPCLLILVFVNPFDALKFLILIIAIQQVDGNIIGPKILGKSIGVSALWVLVAIVIGGDLLGVVGMVVGVPTFATCYGLLRQFTAWCLERRGIDAEGNPRAKQAEPVQPLNENQNQAQPRNETENQPVAVQH